MGVPLVFIDWDQMVKINEMSIFTCAHFLLAAVFLSVSFVAAETVQADHTPRCKKINMAVTKNGKLREKMEIFLLGLNYFFIY